MNKASRRAGGFIHSKMSAGRRHFEAHGEVSPSAEGDLRNFLKKVSACLQAVNHSKTFKLLLSDQRLVFEIKCFAVWTINSTALGK